MKTTLILFITLIIMAGCQPKASKVPYKVDPNNREVVLKEILQAAMYSYLLVTENGNDFWIAVEQSELKVGDTYYFSKFLEMNDFHSKDLNRTFESVLFVENLSFKPIPAAEVNMDEDHSHDGHSHDGHSHDEHSPIESAGKPVMQKHDEKVSPIEGSITLAELGAKRETYNEKIVKVAGKVVKFNPGIMGVNWVHIQDGTENAGFYDLTITTLDEVAVGDIAVFEGKLALKKDFGSGYFYDIILQEAKASIKKIH